MLNSVSESASQRTQYTTSPGLLNFAFVLYPILFWDWAPNWDSHTFLTQSWCVLSCFSCVQLFATPWTAVCQPPLSVGFSRQEYWSGLPCPSPGHLPNPGIKPESSAAPALVGGFFTISPTCESLVMESVSFNSKLTQL